MNRKIAALAAAVALLLVAAYAASPFWAVYQLRRAAVNGDTVALNDRIDFPAVRDSLRSVLTEAVTRKMNADLAMKGNPFGGLGTLIVPALVNRIVDAAVTPEGMAAIIARGRMPGSGSGNAASGRSEAGRSDGGETKVDYAYRGLDRFAVKLRAADARGDALPALLLERRGVFGWKVVAIDLPAGLLDR